MRLHRTLRRAALLPALLLAAAACGGNDADDAAVATRDAAGGTVATTAGVSVSDVKLGSAIDAANRVTTETDDFEPADMVYASVYTTGNAQSTVIAARWTYQDGQVVDSTSRTIAQAGEAVTTFHIMSPSGLPKGEYKVTIFVDGREVETEEFEVKD